MKQSYKNISILKYKPDTIENIALAISCCTSPVSLSENTYLHLKSLLNNYRDTYIGLITYFTV